MDIFYIGFNLPPLQKHALSRICYGLPRVDWLDEEFFYLTAYSLGKIEPNNLENLKDCLSKIDFPIFTMDFSFLSIAKTKGNRGYLWLEISPSKMFIEFRKKLGFYLHSLPLEKKEQKSKPYIMMGHYDHLDAKKFVDYLHSTQYFSLPPVLFENFLLFSIQNTPNKILYRIESLFPLSPLQSFSPEGPLLL